MLRRKAAIKSSISEGIEMYIGNFNKQFMINYKTKKPQTLDADWISNDISKEVKQCNKMVFITLKCVSLDLDLTCVSDIKKHLNLKNCCTWSYKTIKKLCALSGKKLCELVYSEILPEEDKVYLLVFSDKLCLHKNNHKISITWKGNKVSFVFYRNDVLCYEFADGLYAMKGFEEPIFLKWIYER